MRVLKQRTLHSASPRYELLLEAIGYDVKSQRGKFVAAAWGPFRSGGMTIFQLSTISLEELRR